MKELLIRSTCVNLAANVRRRCQKSPVGSHAPEMLLSSPVSRAQDEPGMKRPRRYGDF